MPALSMNRYFGLTGIGSLIISLVFFCSIGFAQDLSSDSTQAAASPPASEPENTNPSPTTDDNGAEPVIGPADVPANSCLAKAGTLDGTGADLPETIDGTAFKKTSHLKKILKKTKDGGLLLIVGGDFKNWKMNDIKHLSNICFKDIDFSNSDWSGGRYEGIGFINSNLSGANLSNVTMPHILLRSTILENTNAKYADFSFGQLDGNWDASIANWDLSQAKLKNFRFSCGNAESNGCAFNRQGVIITGADFSNATLINFALWDSDWSTTKLDNAIVTLNQLPYFTGAKIEDRLLITGAGQIGSIGAAALPLISEMQSRRCEDIADSAARFACDTKDDRLFSLAQDVAILTRTSESKLASGRSFDRHQQAIEACRSGDDETAKPGCIGEALTARRMALLPATAAPALAESAGFAVYLETTLDTAKPGAAAALEQMASVLAGTSNHVVLMRRTANGGDLQLRGAKRNAEGQKICQLRSDRAAFRGANLYKDITDRRQSGAITAYSFEDRLVMDLHSYTSAGGSEACTGTSAQSLVFIPIGGADFERLWSGLDSGSVLGSGPDR